jgi:predicted molibdopterin-dependent oxidoreductase YjgC
VDTEFPLLLVTSIVEHTYLGFPLSAWVEGLRPLFAEGIVDISLEDAERGKIVEGDEVVVTSPHFEKVWRARIVKAQPQGIIDATLDQGESLGPNPTPVRIRKKDV